jgi:drug/metabolite transporter (DMT)-like permease
MNWSLPVADWLWAIALGLLLGLGNLTVLAAFATGGKAAIVTPMAGLYPAITVALAVGFLGERVRSREWLAIGLALVAVVALSRESPAKPSKTTIPSTT